MLSMRKNIISIFDLSNKIAVVTGAGSGLGKVISEVMGEAGASVVCVDVNEKTARMTSSDIKKLNVDSMHIRCDVSKEKEVLDMFESIFKKFGKVDIFFNNAGISGDNVKLCELSLKRWNKVIGINLTGIFLCSREAVKIMVKQKSGKIINISSILSFVGGFPNLMIPAYHAAKGAINSLTREMALEYAKDGICINAIAPGFFYTNISKRLKDPNVRGTMESLIPMGIIAEARDIKGTALFLASKASDYITGTILVIDGGYSVK